MDNRSGSKQDDADDVPPALAEQIYQGKRINELETQLRDIDKLVHSLRSTSVQAEEQLRQTISQADLRRAMAGAFQEFEMRMQEELQQTHRTVLSQFCKRDEVQEVVSLVSKKVNWHDYQSLLGKVTELRTYIDHTAESIFLGQRDALQQEFARKADATAVDMALKAKADFREINDLRARLERLEMLFTGLGAHQNARFDELREDITSSFFSKVTTLEGQLKEQEDFKRDLENTFASNSKERDEIRASVRGVSSRLDTMLEKLPSTGEALSKVDRQAKETESLLNNIRKEKFAETERIKQLQERFLVIEEKFDKQTDDMHKSTARSDEQIAFLTEASEQLKRRVREVARNMSDQHKSLALEKDQLEARLMRVVMDSGALPEKVDELSRR